MGLTISRSTPPTDEEKNILPAHVLDYTPYHGLPVPPEASMTREDSQDWYTSFFDKAECVPHRDGKHIIVRWPNLPRGHIHDYGRELTGWPIIKLRIACERLEKEHPRIVRYTGSLPDGSITLEKLSPGPFDLNLPSMTVPISNTQSRHDSVMLSLYYRWALQSLSALTILHSHHIYLRTFSPPIIWLRSDLSLALTGFIGAEIVGDTTDYLECSGVCAEETTFDEDALHGCVEEDLFYWATFMWRCMTNDFTDESPGRDGGCWEPCCPVEGGCKPYDEDSEVFDERYLKGMWQELEETRLGSVLVKAWNKGYGDAREVVEDVRAIAEKVGIVVVGEDEVEIEGRWEDVFEEVEERPRPYRNRSLRFKEIELSKSDLLELGIK